jgi:hypothetical protein
VSGGNKCLVNSIQHVQPPHASSVKQQRAVSVAEVAQAEGMDVTQVRRLLRLTLLAPKDWKS